VGEAEVVPVEVRIRSEVKRRDAMPLFKFLHRRKGARGYIISDGTETPFSDGERSVDVIPCWMYWTLMSGLTGGGAKRPVASPLTRGDTMVVRAGIVENAVWHLGIVHNFGRGNDPARVYDEI